MSIQNKTEISYSVRNNQSWFIVFREKLIRDLRRDYLLYIMILPMMLWFLIFLYKPMIGLQIAFKDFSLWRGIAGSEWIGFDHFVTLFSDDYFIRAIKNTFVISFYSLLFAFPFPILLAVMFNEFRNTWLKRGAQTIVYLPHFISVVVLAGIVVNFMSPSTGVVNHILEALGFERIYFLAQPEFFRPIFIGSNIWKEAGFESIVYMAAIAGINPELYEAARVDGANRWKIIRHVTIPCIIPTILIMLIIRIGNIVEVGFEYVILLYQPSTYESADVISTFIYRNGLVRIQVV